MPNHIKKTEKTQNDTKNFVNIPTERKAWKDILRVKKENDYEPDHCNQKHGLLKFMEKERHKKKVINDRGHPFKMHCRS